MLILQDVTTVPTPAPTPEPSVKEPPSPVRTPDLSEHLSTALSPKKNHQESATPGLTMISRNIMNHSPYTCCQQTQQLFVKVLSTVVHTHQSALQPFCLCFSTRKNSCGHTEYHTNPVSHQGGHTLSSSSQSEPRVSHPAASPMGRNRAPLGGGRTA